MITLDHPDTTKNCRLLFTIATLIIGVT